MRLIITVVTFVIIGTAILNSDDLLSKLDWSLFGNSDKDPMVISPNDDFQREYSYINNDQEAEWGKVNFGSLAAIQNITTDVNGVEAIGISDTTPMKDMVANALAESKVKPFPSGVTISVLPGVQPNGKTLNSFVFTPHATNTTLAPRDVYVSKASVNGTFNEAGTYSSKGSANLVVFQVPTGEEMFVKETTGTVKTASEASAAALEAKKVLDKLRAVVNDNKQKNSGTAYSELLLNKEQTGVSREFANINALLNNGSYSSHYRAGLQIALGDSSSLPAVNIKTDSIRDVYAQFDYIYANLIDDRLTRKYYSPALTSWAKSNAVSILNTLMVNYAIQSQDSGVTGPYSTPITMKHAKEGTYPYYKDLVAKGRQTKEPFFLYANIIKQGGVTGNKLQTLPNDAIVPDLSYIFGLYNAIQIEVWIGADGLLSNNLNKVIKSMNSDIDKQRVAGDNLPIGANNVSSSWSKYSSNNLVSGLSGSKTRKKGQATVYPNQKIVGALRATLTKGSSGAESNQLNLYKNKFNITKLTDKTYLKNNKSSYLASAFATGGSSFERWKNLVVAADKTPLQPAIFRSYWGGGQFYVMMPTMLGGTAFPSSLGQLINNVATKGGGTAEGSNSDSPIDLDNNGFLQLSYSNHYVLAFNFKSSIEPRTTGVTVIEAEKSLGSPRDAKKRVVFTGYTGGEGFNIVDYAKATVALEAEKAKSGLTAKDVKGQTKSLEHFAMLQDFFTIKNQDDFIGTGTGELKYASTFSKNDYKKMYSDHINLPAIKKISPNYTTFFDKPKEENKEK